MSIIPFLAATTRRGDRGVGAAGWQSGVVRISGIDQVSVFGTRIVRLGRLRVGLLMCGEVFNHELAEALGAEKPNVVVNLGHRSMGRGFWSRLPRVAAAAGCPVYHAQHVALGSCAPKWMATHLTAKRVVSCDWASRKRAWTGRDLWAEVKVWNVRSLDGSSL